MKSVLTAACLLLGSVVIFSGCASNTQEASDTPPPADTEPSMLATGQWNGGLVPMNHLDQTTPLVFSVDYENDALAMVLAGPGGMEIPIRNAAVDGDTLRFEFNEPEMGVLLTCALGGAPSSGFEGRCSDADGKWAKVTMTPPGS